MRKVDTIEEFNRGRGVRGDDIRLSEDGRHLVDEYGFRKILIKDLSDDDQRRVRHRIIMEEIPTYVD